MAQLNYPYQWTDQWGNYIGPQQGNGSNLSLNMMPPGYPMWMPQQYPPGWRGPMPMYPYPVNMPPPADDRRSRAHSPAMSTKSRKSQMSRMTNTNRRRKSKDILNDDDDRRSIRSYTHHRDNESVERMSVSRRPPRNISSRTVSPLPVTRKLSTRSSMSVERDTKKHLPVRVPESSSSSEVESESEPGMDSEIESEEEMEISEEEPVEPQKVEVDASRIDTPPYEWICEHCTFNNSPNVRICSVCCKTPTSMPQKSVPKSSGTNTPLKKKSVKKDAAVGASSPTKSMKKSVDEINNEFKQCRVSSATESVADEIYEQLNAKPSSITSSTSKKKGNLRKISFWPGTKFPTLGK